MKKLTLLLKTLAILYFFFGIKGLVFGQQNIIPGIVIQHSGDSLHGFIRVNTDKENALQCLFKSQEEDSKFTKYSPLDIKGYIIDSSRYYASKQFELNDEIKNVFLEYMVKGYANLYYMKVNGVDSYFLEKESKIIQLSNESIVQSKNGNLYKRESNQYKGAMRIMFSDSPEMYDQIGSTSFNQKSLVGMTKKYHKSICDDYSCIDYTRKKIKSKHWLEPMLGLSSPWSSSDKDHDGFNYGINYIGTAGNPNNGLKYFVGVHFASGSYSSSYSNEYIAPHPIFNFEVTVLEEETVSSSYRHIELPVGLEYSPFQGRFQPLVRLAMNVLFFRKSEYEYFYSERLTRTSDGLFDLDGTIDDDELNLGADFKLNASIGLKYSFKNNNYFLLLLSTEKISDIKYYPNERLYNVSIAFAFDLSSLF